VVTANPFRRENICDCLKGGGHSYQGIMRGLLIWTRAINNIVVHTPSLVRVWGNVNAQPAVTVESGAMWMHTYNAVTTILPLRPGGGCADGRRRGLNPKRGVRKLFEKIWHRCRWVAGSLDRY